MPIHTDAPDTLAPSSPTRLRTRAAALWQWLTLPLTPIADYEAHLKSQWLTAVLVCLMPIGLVLSALPSLHPPTAQAWWQVPSLFVTLALVVTFVPLYLLSRFGRYHLVAGLLVTISTLAIIASIVLDTDPTSRAFDAAMLAMPVLFASILFGTRVTLVVVSVDLVSLLCLPLFLPALTFQDILSGPFNIVFLAVGLSILGAQMQDRLKRHQTDHLLAMNLDLRAEIAQRAQAEAQISTVLREKEALLRDREANLHEKEVLLKEIHHRVKNNLQVVSSLLSLQSRSVSDPQTIDVLRDSQNRVRSMALVHEKLYRSPSLARVDFGEYAHSLTTQLFSTYAARAGAVTPCVRVDNCWLDVDTAVPCGLIISELVSNALKYAFPDGREGQLNITIETSDADRVTLRISDDGVGFPDGVDFLHSTSLGLQLVNSLVDQIGGTIQLETGAGTRFVIDFSALHDGA